MSVKFLRLAAKSRAYIVPLLALLLPLCAITVEARTPMRAIYVESGPLDYNLRVLTGLARVLHDEGFLISEPPRSLTDKGTAKKFWQWMGEQSDKTRVRFLADGFYSSEWDDDRRRELIETVCQRLEKRGDVDVIFAFGTWAGIDMAALPTNVPIIALAITNAVTAGIVPSVADSGKDNLVAVVEPMRYKRQVEYFHEILPFKRLGVVYEDSPTGRSMVGLNEIESAANGLGVELVRCRTVMHEADADVVADRVEECHRSLINQHADAVYLTFNVTMTAEQKRRTLAPLIEKNVPTFSQVGTEDVRHGALASCIDTGIAEGRFAARLVRGVYDGLLPRAMSQRFQSPLLLAINVRTASYIGWNPPLEVLSSVDRFYE